LHPLLRIHVFDCLRTCQAALPLLFRQFIHLLQLLNQALLICLRQALEARIVAQQLLLTLCGKIAVLVEPGAKMSWRRSTRICR